MDHASAIETYAAERYLLGELNDAEAESFEEHYFDCAECAEDVRHGMQLIEGGREIARDAATNDNVVAIADRRQKRIGWMQLGAAAVLAVGIAVPQFVQRDRDIRTSISPYRKLEANRATGPMTFKHGQLISAPFEIQPQPGAVRYEAVLRNAKRETLGATRIITAEQANDAQSLTTDPLPVGSYELSITGVRGDGNRAGIETFEFQVVE
ncbi:MAG: hypothetical protein ACTHQM_20400 [Thermoanaerobaculia bacterium]